jgi:hypothetical protein
MTLEQFKTQLDTLNIPVAYMAFAEAQEPPFLVYYEDASNNFFADNTVHKRISEITVELYTKFKDTTLEGQLEDLLGRWQKSSSYVPEEKLLLTAYSFSTELDEAVISA